MFQELLTVWRVFLKTHKRSLLPCLLLEGVVLLAAQIALPYATDIWLKEYRHYDSLLLFISPPLVLQIYLATYLALVFSDRAPEAWFMRLPLSRAAISGVSYALIWSNALLLGALLLPAWSLFYELTVFPVSIALVLAPSLAFQVARRFRKPLQSVVAAISVALATFAVTAVAGLLYYRGNFPLSRFGVLQMNMFLLILSLLIPLALDPGRWRLAKLTALAVALPCAVLAAESVRERKTGFHQELVRLKTTNLSHAIQCDRFKEDALTINKDFRNRIEVQKAATLLNTFPKRSISREELHQAWKRISAEPSIRPAWNTLMSIRTCGIDVFDLRRRMIIALQNGLDIPAAERKQITGELWNSVMQTTRESFGLIEAFTNIALIRMMIDYKLVNGIAPELISKLNSRLEEIRSDARRAHGDILGKIRAPTDQRRRLYARSLYDSEIAPSAQVIEETIALLNRVSLAP